MMTTADPAELDRLWRELLHRLDAHPMTNWSSGLLEAVIAVIDAAVPDVLAMPQESRFITTPRLSVVRAETRVDSRCR